MIMRRISLNKKIAELNNDLSDLEKDKEVMLLYALNNLVQNSGEVIQKSIREVNIMYSQQIEYLQQDLINTRAEASQKIVDLSNQMTELQNLNKIQETCITNQRNKIKEMKYQHEISSKALNYKLEKSE